MTPTEEGIGLSSHLRFTIEGMHSRELCLQHALLGDTQMPSNHAMLDQQHLLLHSNCSECIIICDVREGHGFSS